jgi:CDP-4-dehydro-6-deoxyglucose reductase
MAYKIRLEPSGREFAAEPTESVLAAALRQGLVLPHSCRNGSCGTCKGKLLSGRVEYGEAPLPALTDEERRAGYALFCQARAASDLVIEAREVTRLAGIPVKILPCRVIAMERAAPDVMILRLKAPQHERLQYLAGQYIDILLSGGARRSFSIANPPNRDEFLELHVRRVEGGLFTTHVFEKMQEKDLLRFQGPLGTFFLHDENPGTEAVLIAGGTGYAPVQAMVEQALAQGGTRRFHVYWGARARRDLYRHAQVEALARAHPALRYTPVLSEPRPEDDWRGRTGWVHEAALADYPDLSAVEVYACGPPVMVAAVRESFLARGLPASRLYSDSFELTHAAAR